MFLKDLLFPKICVGCGFIGSYICPKCEKKLDYFEGDRCLYCDRLSLYGLTHPTCKKDDRIDGMLSMFHYNDFLKKVIKTFKYRLVTEMWSDFCLIIKPQKMSKLNYFKNNNSQFIIQPIPLFPEREKIRGFNQSKIISLYFSNILKIPIVDLLKRNKNTQPQAQIAEGRRRYKNIQGAFTYCNENNLLNKSIILIDDVSTTGLTLREAAKELKNSGIKRVYGLTIARG